jgi:hypothetical protein
VPKANPHLPNPLPQIVMENMIDAKIDILELGKTVEYML